jgi:class 3 adenylate cyclase
LKDEWQDRDARGRTPGRFDFQVRTISTDDETRTVQVALIPEPRRYDSIEIGGEPHYMDKFLKIAVPKKIMLEAAARQMRGMPMFFQPPSINSTKTYSTARKQALDNELAGGEYSAPSELAKQQVAIDAAPERALTFLSVDICGSTALRHADAGKFERAHQILVRELGTVVGHFHGSILKLTGDGFIAYIDYPAFTTQCDNTVDLGLSMLQLLRDSVRPALVEVGLPDIQIRVGADRGPAKVRTVSIPATKFLQTEIASDALNRAVKIEQSAKAGQFRIGRALYELLHTKWLERSHQVAGTAVDVGLAGYPVYEVR